MLTLKNELCNIAILRDAKKKRFRNHKITTENKSKQTISISYDTYRTMKTRRLMLQYFKFMTCSTGASLSLAFTTTTSMTIRRRITSTSTSTKYLSNIRSFTQHHANANANANANGSANANAAAIEVVQRYFQGVTEKDPSMIRSCFDTTATIRDVYNTIGSSEERVVDADKLVERCMDFVTAHPDCRVQFHYGPAAVIPTTTSNTNNDSDTNTDTDTNCWVLAHWYETGTWCGESCNIPVPDPPRNMKCEGQTRFQINTSTNTIDKFIVTRTFTEWETKFQQQQRSNTKLVLPSLTIPSDVFTNNNNNNNNHNNDHNTDANNEPQQQQQLLLLKSMAETAEMAARLAGKVIVSEKGCCNESSEECDIKFSIKDVVTQYDKEAQEVVETTIRSKFPSHMFLGEEDVPAGGEASIKALRDILANTKDNYIWIVDPIDGTANFASGLDLCGVTVTVVKDNKALIGVIYDPHKDEMFTAIDGKGAYCNGERIYATSQIDTVQDAIINAGCPADPNAFAASMRGVMAMNSKCRGIRILACSALTLAWVASGRLGGHYGYDLSSWDLIAGALIVQEADGIITDLNGSPYTIETRNMLVCANTGIHTEILDILHTADAVSFERV